MLIENWVAPDLEDVLVQEHGFVPQEVGGLVAQAIIPATPQLPACTAQTIIAQLRPCLRCTCPVGGCDEGRQVLM
jgi:hypothetical protein